MQAQICSSGCSGGSIIPDDGPDDYAIMLVINVLYLLLELVELFKGQRLNCIML